MTFNYALAVVFPMKNRTRLNKKKIGSVIVSWKAEGSSGSTPAAGFNASPPFTGTAQPTRMSWGPAFVLSPGAHVRTTHSSPYSRKSPDDSL